MVKVSYLFSGTPWLRPAWGRRPRHWTASALIHTLHWVNKHFALRRAYNSLPTSQTRRHPPPLGGGPDCGCLLRLGRASRRLYDAECGAVSAWGDAEDARARDGAGAAAAGDTTGDAVTQDWRVTRRPASAPDCGTNGNIPLFSRDGRNFPGMVSCLFSEF